MSATHDAWITILGGPVLILAEDLRDAWDACGQVNADWPRTLGTIDVTVVGARSGLLLGCSACHVLIIPRTSHECYLLLSVRRPTQPVNPSQLALLPGWQRHSLALHLRQPPLLLTDASGEPNQGEWHPLPLAAGSYELWTVTTPALGALHHLRPATGVAQGVAALRAGEAHAVVPLPVSDDNEDLPRAIPSRPRA